MAARLGMGLPCCGRLRRVGLGLGRGLGLSIWWLGRWLSVWLRGLGRVRLLPALWLVLIGIDTVSRRVRSLAMGSREALHASSTGTAGSRSSVCCRSIEA